MKGAILCGGKSSRMGSDKGMLPLHELHWAQSIATLFTGLKLPFVVSVNKEQEIDYKKLFDPEQLITDDKTLNVKGPLLGLLSLHKNFPDEDLVVIACDMIEMQLAPLQMLCNNYLLHRGFNAYLFKTNDKLQPLCTIYTSDFLKEILTTLLAGNLNKFSLTLLLNQSVNFIITAPTEWQHYFNNYNSPEDLSSLQQQI